MSDDLDRGCPFYGGTIFENELIPFNSNRCALIIDSHTPCMMEVHMQVDPDAATCPLIMRIRLGMGLVGKYVDRC